MIAQGKAPSCLKQNQRWKWAWMVGFLAFEVSMDGWIPSGVRYQGKYHHLNCLYAGFTFTYLFKHNTGFSFSDFLSLLREISSTFAYRCGNNIKIRPLNLCEFPCDKGSYKNQMRNSCVFLPEVAVLSKQQCLKVHQVVHTSISVKDKSQPFRLAKQWLYWFTQLTTIVSSCPAFFINGNCLCNYCEIFQCPLLLVKAWSQKKVMVWHIE